MAQGPRRPAAAAAEHQRRRPDHRLQLRRGRSADASHQPDGSWIGYEYDAAHRQIPVLDNQNNRIEYTLDNAGNRIAENVRDPSNALVRQLTRVMDALGRVQQTTGRQ